MRVLVTGGAGFIGSHVVGALLRRGTDVCVLDNFSTGRAENIPAGAAVVDGSVCDPKLVRHLGSHVDAVVHLAAAVSVPASVAEPEATIDTNIGGLVPVLESAREQGSYLVFASSAAVYGNRTGLLAESLPTMSESPYAASKAAGEALVQAYQASFGVRACAFRFFNVYGPRQGTGGGYASVIPAFLNAVIANQPLTIYGDGTQSRDSVHVSTVARAIEWVTQTGANVESPVNLGGGESVTVQELAHQVCSLGRAEPRIEYKPARPGDVTHSRADTGRLRTLLPWLSNIPLSGGLRETFEWFVKQSGTASEKLTRARPD